MSISPSDQALYTNLVNSNNRTQASIRSVQLGMAETERDLPTRTATAAACSAGFMGVIIAPFSLLLLPAAGAAVATSTGLGIGAAANAAGVAATTATVTGTTGGAALAGGLAGYILGSGSSSVSPNQATQTGAQAQQGNGNANIRMLVAQELQRKINLDAQGKTILLEEEKQRDRISREVFKVSYAAGVTTGIIGGAILAPVLAAPVVGLALYGGAIGIMGGVFGAMIAVPTPPKKAD